MGRSWNGGRIRRSWPGAAGTPSSTSCSSVDRPPFRMAMVWARGLKGKLRWDTMATADARPGSTPIGVPDDAALPGVVFLHQPRRLVEVLSPLLTEGLDPGARLVDSRVAIHRYVPGKRCIFELELAFEA